MGSALKPLTAPMGGAKDELQLAARGSANIEENL